MIIVTISPAPAVSGAIFLRIDNGGVGRPGAQIDRQRARGAGEW